MGNIGRAKGERMAEKLRATVAGQTDDPEHLLDVLIAAWEEMHREAQQHKGAVEAELRAIVEQARSAGDGRPFTGVMLDQQIGRVVLDRLGGQ